MRAIIIIIFLFYASIAQAVAKNPEIEELYDIIKKMQKANEEMERQYKTQISDLKDRIKKLETNQESLATAAIEPQADSIVDRVLDILDEEGEEESFAEGEVERFGITAVLNGRASAFSKNPSSFAIPGFALGGGGTSPGSEGLSINGSELHIVGDISESINGALMVVHSPTGGSAVRMGFLHFRNLLDGLSIKAGRMPANLGYLNSRLPHLDDFSDRPLTHRAMLGNVYGDDGVELRYNNMFDDIFAQIGGGIFRGRNFPAGGSANDGFGSASAFLQFGNLIDRKSQWRAGLSYLHAESEGRLTGSDSFTGDSDLFIVDGRWEFSPSDNIYNDSLTFQGEFLFRNEDGTFNTVDYDSNQWGWYGQALYKFNPKWRIGYRHSELHSDNISSALVGSTLDDLGHTPKSDSIMIDYKPWDSTIFRLQYSHDQSQSKKDNQIILQYVAKYGLFQ